MEINIKEIKYIRRFREVCFSMARPLEEIQTRKES